MPEVVVTELMKQISKNIKTLPAAKLQPQENKEEKILEVYRRHRQVNRRMLDLIFEIDPIQF